MRKFRCDTLPNSLSYDATLPDKLKEVSEKVPEHLDIFEINCDISTIQSPNLLLYNILMTFMRDINISWNLEKRQKGNNFNVLTATPVL